MKLSSYVNEKIEKVRGLAGLVEEINIKNKYEQKEDAYVRLITECISMTNHIKRVACEEICKEDIDESLKSYIGMLISTNDEIVRIKINSLLPTRIKNNNFNEYEIVQKVYLAPLAKLLKESQIQMYEEKVIIFFLFHFTKDSIVVDLDNFYTKPFIDAIAVTLLLDDSAGLVSLFLDADFDNEEESTEIYMIPKHLFFDFYKGDYKYV